MRAVVVRTPAGIIGASEQDQAAFDKFRAVMRNLPDGQHMRIEWARPRNGGHHRLVFALLKLIADNHPTFDTTEKALVAVKILTGHCEPMTDPRSGETVLVPASISYDAMSEDDFSEWHARAVDQVCEHLLPQMDPETAQRLADQIAAGW